MSCADIVESFIDREVRKKFTVHVLQLAEQRGMITHVAPPGQIWCIFATLPASLDDELEIGTKIFPVLSLPDTSELTREQVRADQQKAGPNGCAVVVVFAGPGVAFGGTVTLSPIRAGARAGCP